MSSTRRGFIAGKVWPPEDKERALRLHQSGQPDGAIAAQIGRTEAAVAAFLHRMATERPVRRTTRRECLCCGKPFSSEGPHNRCCGRCANLSVSPYAP